MTSRLHVDSGLLKIAGFANCSQIPEGVRNKFTCLDSGYSQFTNMFKLHYLSNNPLTCRYLENVPAIVPLLEKEFRNAAKRLEDTQDELNDLNPTK